MTRRLTWIGLLTAAASILFALETPINLPVPWIRLGLANIVTVLVLEWWSLRETLIVVVLRSVVGSVLMGKLMHPDFVFSLVGGIAAALAMWLMVAYGKKWFGFIGVSVAGALVKNAVQLGLAYALVVRHVYLFSILPLLFAVSLISGLIVGFLAFGVNRGFQLAVRNRG